MSTTTKNNMKKSVRFAASNEVCATISLSELTQREIDAAWYNEDDYCTFSRKCEKIMRLMERGESKQYCTRGLERLVGDRRTLLSLNRELAYDMVLNEQDAQMHEGTHNPQHIADAYANVSTPCHRRAHRTALLDEHIIRPYLSKERATMQPFLQNNAAAPDQPKQQQQQQQKQQQPKQQQRQLTQSSTTLPRCIQRGETVARCA